MEQMLIAAWIAQNCKFAAKTPESQAVAEEAWKWFGLEEDFQTNRHFMKRCGYDQWFEDDRVALMQADQAGDVQKLTQLRDKYKQIDDQIRMPGKGRMERPLPVA